MKEFKNLKHPEPHHNSGAFYTLFIARILLAPSDAFKMTLQYLYGIEFSLPALLDEMFIRVRVERKSYLKMPSVPIEREIQNQAQHFLEKRFDTQIFLRNIEGLRK